VSAVIRWEDPPRPAVGGGVHLVSHDWAGVAKALRRRPGRWGLVAVCANVSLAGQAANYIRVGHYVPFRDGIHEAVSRKVADECRVYARYVGEV